VVAHRGGSPADTDNSLAAFGHALAVGAHLVECDLRTTRDGVVALYHDPRCHGLTIRRRRIDELRAAIPTLITFEELLEHVSGHDAEYRLVLDLKERDTDRTLAPLIERHGLERRVIVTSRYALSLRRLRRQFPLLRMGLSRGSSLAQLRPAALRRAYHRLLRIVFPVLVFLQLRWCGATAVSFHYSLIDSRSVRRYHRLGYRIYAWTVNDCWLARRMARAGVDLVATDLPQEILPCLGWEDSAHTPFP
jgi:glycerophosphoryl diester phosphodiesterase